MKNLIALSAYIGLGLACAPALAALQPVSEAPLSSRTDVQCAFNEDASRDCVTTISYTILKPAGRDMLSRIDFNYPENDRFVVEQASYSQPGEAAVALDPSRIDTRTAPNPDAGFRRDKQTSLAFPSLRVGTTIQYTIRHHVDAMPLVNGFHYMLEFAPEPVRSDAYSARFTAPRTIVWQAELADDFQIALSPDTRTLTIEQKAPRYFNFINEADNAYLQKIPRIALASSMDAASHLGPFAQRYNEILAAPLPPRSQQAALHARSLPMRERVAYLMQHIDENYRYLGDWRSTERGYVPFSLEEIEQHGYGDCKDLAVLLAAMLKASGIAAEPALVFRGISAPALLIPGPLAPNHAIVRAQVDGQAWWLDPTNSVFVPGRTMPDLQERWALVMDAGGAIRQETIALEPPVSSVTVRRDEQYDHEGRARIQSTTSIAALALAQMSLADRGQGGTSFNNELCRNVGREPVDCAVTRDELGFTVPPAYEAKVALTDLNPLDKVSGQYVYQRDDLRIMWEQFANYVREGQQADIYLGDPYTAVYDVSISLGHTADSLHDCAVQSPWFDLDLKNASAGAIARYHYTLTQKKRVLTHQEIRSDAFQDLVRQARDCVGQLRLPVTLPKS
ncbi:MAG: DUF3857 domain-containing transglutaminase family protein [Candidimonas sp.]|jgi:transglutaminase-like putative cysteine protease